MPTVSSGAEAAPVCVTFRGKNYHFKPLTFEVMQSLEKTLFAEEKDRLKAMEGLYSPEVLEKKADELFQRYDNGEYSFLAARAQKWLKTPTGAAALLKLTLGIGDEELIPLIMDKGAELKAILDKLLTNASVEGED